MADDINDIIANPDRVNASTEALREYLEVQRQVLEMQGQFSESQMRVAEAQEALTEQERESNRLRKETENLIQTRKQLERELRAAKEASAGVETEEIKRLQNRIENQKDLIKTQKEELETSEKLIRAKAALTSVNKVAEKSAKEFVTMATGIKDMKNATSDFDKVLYGLAEGTIGLEDVAEGINTAAASFGEMFSKANLIANAMKFLYEAFLINIESAIAIDRAIVNFNKTIGSPGGFNDLLSDASDDLLRFGVSAADAVQNIGTLVNTVRSFADLNQDAQEEIAQFVSLLNKMGFSADAQAKNIVFLNKSFGLSEKAAAKFNTRLMSIANSLDMPIGDVVQGFQDAQKVLGASAGSAEELSQQFGQLAAQADATNLSIGKLVDLSMKFDTFDTAAQQVGKLNAMLGGPFLSTVEMVTATNPAERIEMLADSLDRAGKSFDDMSYFERKAIADAAGLQDVNDLALLMSGNLSDITGPDLSESEIVEMKKQMAEFNDVMEAFANMARATVTSFAPVVFMIKDVFSFVADVLSFTIVPLFEGIKIGVQALFTPISEFVGMLFDNFPQLQSFLDSFEGSSDKIATIFRVIGGLLTGIIVPAMANMVVASGIILRNKLLTLGASIKELYVNRQQVLTQAAELTKSFGIAVTKIFSSLAALGPIGLTFGAAGIIAAMAGAISAYKADDLLSPGQDSDGYGDRMILGPEGAFALNNRDTVVAGTNLTQNTVNNNTTTAQAAAPAAATPTGPINMNVVLSIDGSEIRTVVNSVKVDPTLNSNLYNSIAKLITSGDEAR